MLLLACVACEQPAPPATNAVEGGFNLTLYLQSQIERMQTEKPMVLKSVSSQDQPPETIETDAIDWEDELAVFEQTDINKPTLQEYYTRQETVLDNGDILLEYTKTEESEPLVHYLLLTLTPDRRLKQLEATLQDKNPLFYSKRQVQLQTAPGTGNISTYTVKGVQKLIFGDSLRYSVNANL